MGGFGQSSYGSAKAGPDRASPSAWRWRGPGSTSPRTACWSIGNRFPGGKIVNVRAGDSLDDLCRVCKNVRSHTVIAADSQGTALRVVCDYCGSQHNYRGGEAGESRSNARPEISERPHIALVTERERRFPMADGILPGGSAIDLEMMLRRIIREETGLTPGSVRSG